MEKTSRNRKSKLLTKFKLRNLRIFSRHPSHNAIRNTIKVPFLALLRLGSTTTGSVKYAVELNSPDSVRNSSSKLRMKKCFLKQGVKTADWWIYNGESFGKSIGIIEEQVANTDVPMEFPIVAKRHFGSRGQGNTLIKTKEDFDKWIVGKTLTNYIFEKFYNYSREYRLHVTEDGCFYTCRKMLKEGIPEEEKWHRHESNCVWILEENPAFDKPSNWSTVIEHSVFALKSVGLDVGAVDLKIQSATDSKGRTRENPDFIVVEINSAPAFGEKTTEVYTKVLKELLIKKYNGNNSLHTTK